ncbi:MAG: hypothetical protein J6Z33_01115 [Lachnospiraceae bacterium]|nr:hypothetical protein [Lachnospiraceae bacterium]MBP5262954.1 hypothetical protein [Lachnospiraceae bacterium]
MKETLLFKAASAWVSLSRYRYSFTYGFRMKLYDLHLSFYPNDFPHLAGFQYLKDLNLPRYTPSKIIQKILEGTITQEQIEQNQRSYVLLHKTKTRLSDGETQILFTKPGFDEHKSSISKPLLF